MTSLVDILFTEAAPMMEAIRNAVATGDATKLEKSAHRLKGSVSIFGAEESTRAAFALEKLGHGGEMANAPAAFAQLEQHMAALLAALKQFRNELQP